MASAAERRVARSGRIIGFLTLSIPCLLGLGIAAGWLEVPATLTTSLLVGAVSTLLVTALAMMFGSRGLRLLGLAGCCAMALSVAGAMALDPRAQCLTDQVVLGVTSLLLLFAAVAVWWTAPSRNPADGPPTDRNLASRGARR